jgi:hypothetical protein
MPWTSTVRAAASIATTPSSPETSRPGAATDERARKRFEVRLASLTGASAGIAS